MTTDIKEPADWSNLPRDMYVTHVKVSDGFVWEVKMCSVPMMTVPEVRYVRADALEAMVGEVERLKEERDAAREDEELMSKAKQLCEAERDRLKAALLEIKADPIIAVAVAERALGGDA